jgi:hypothetical protein
MVKMVKYRMYDRVTTKVRDRVRNRDAMIKVINHGYSKLMLKHGNTTEGLNT